MEIILPADLEGKLSRLAAEQGRDRSSLVVEAVERMVDHDAWFVAEVEKGLAELEQGQTLSHEEVGERLEERLTQRRPA
jgi:predicted transcriptional regulator